MGAKYSKEPFYGYTHRFKVDFFMTDYSVFDIDIYSDNGNHKDLLDFINQKKKSDKVSRIAVANIATKEDDEMATELINELLKQ